MNTVQDLSLKSFDHVFGFASSSVTKSKESREKLRNEVTTNNDTELVIPSDVEATKNDTEIVIKNDNQFGNSSTIETTQIDAAIIIPHSKGVFDLITGKKKKQQTLQAVD